MNFYQITNFESEDAINAAKIYNETSKNIDNFPWDKIIEILKTDSNYKLYSFKDEKLIGFSLMYFDKKEKITFLDHMAIHPRFQNLGWGSQLFELCFKLAKNKFPDSLGLFFLVLKNNALDFNEQKIRKKRISFYLRLDCSIINDVLFDLPPTNTTSEKAFLMIKPFHDIENMEKNFIIKLIDFIYKKIYQHQNYDLTKTYDKIPSKITLRGNINDI